MVPGSLNIKKFKTILKRSISIIKHTAFYEHDLVLSIQPYLRLTEMKRISRRSFVKTEAVTALGLSFLPTISMSAKESGKPVKVGIIGTGTRGTDHVGTLLDIEGVEISALCDLTESKAANAANMCEKAGKKRPTIYCKDKFTYKEMLDREKLDAVIIATYWDSHAAIALHAMKNGIYPGVEVPAALTVDDNWKLVETSEKTGVPCMMLENWSFRQDNLALLNMKRLGMFGEIVHCHCAHSHECMDYWFFDFETGNQL